MNRIHDSQYIDKYRFHIISKQNNLINVLITRVESEPEVEDFFYM